MENSSDGRHRWNFGRFDVDLATGELHKHGRLVPLQDQPFRVLATLLERPGELVTREDLRKKLWPDGTFVDFDEGIDTALRKLRQALGDSAQNPVFIETIPKRGHRFIAPVASNGSGTPEFLVSRPPVPPEVATESLSPFGPIDVSGKSRATTRRAPAIVKYAAAVGILLLAVLAFRLYKSSSHANMPELKLRQLTINSVENPVSSGAISPDGKYVAYADVKGVSLHLIEIGETRTITPRDPTNGDNVDWEIPAAAWFPDSSRFLANARRAGIEAGRRSSETCTIWVFSVLGGPPIKLRDNAAAWSVSPDGSSISFTTNSGKGGDREAWLMRPTGEQAHLNFAAAENSSISKVQWSPDSRRVSYMQTDDSGETIESRGPNGGSATIVLSRSAITDVGDYSWLPDGRLIYSVRTRQLTSGECNYWTTRVDQSTGRVIEKPRRLTNWAGFCLNYTSVTKDGKRLVFQESAVHSETYLADLEDHGTRIRNPKRFTLHDSEEMIADWTADGKTTILVSDLEDDRYEVRKQNIEEETSTLLARSEAGNWSIAAQVSPGGNWVIIEVYPIFGGPSAPWPLVRVPLSGGPPEPIFSAPAGSGFACARAPSDLCTLAEPSADHKQLVVTAFDPVRKQRGKELARVNLESPKDDYWPLFALSPDGTRLAISRSEAGPIELLSLQGLPTKIIHARDVTQMKLLSFAADKKGIFLVNGVQDGTALLHVDLQGNVHTLWRCRGGQRCDFTPSPNGRHLAILDRQQSANLWMMENF